MQRSRKASLVVGLLAAAGVVGAWACGNELTQCKETQGCGLDAEDASSDSPLIQATLPDVAEAMATTVEKDKDAGDGGTLDGARDASADAGCVMGAAPAEGGCISDASGLFVATTGSDTTGTGTTAKPYATVSKALGQLGGAASTAIYVCGGTYTDQITVSGGVSIYGGLTCTDGHWVYSSKTIPVLTGTTASFAVEVDGVSAAVDLEDLEIDGADASAGDSTIALWLNNSANVSLHRVKVVGATGGHGAKGANGAATPNYATTDAGVEGGAGATGNGGGVGGENACADGTMPQGGQGGPGGGGEAHGTSGAPAYTSPVPAGATGAGGAVGTVCVAFPGSYGENGGAAGVVAANAGAWSVSSAAWIPSTSGPGTGGGPGQGGGGGGGNTGGGGGGGGAGGCGGATGRGGTSGGASFALLSIDSTVTLDHCQIVGGTGGAGGNGGDGEAGQTPGGPGSGAGAVGVAGCSGGTGGFGQGGGGGAGGAGGPSVAVAYTGTAPSDPGSTSTVTPGAAVPTQATGGAGGSGGTVPNPDDGTGGPAGTKTLPVATLSLPTTT